MNLVSEIKDIIENGLIKDIFKAERANYLIKTINKKIHKINDKSYSNFGVFFGTIQSYMINEFILSISRIYDKQNKHETRCLDYLLKKLESIKTEPFKIEQYNQIYQYLEFNKMHDLLNSIDDDRQFVTSLCDYIKINNSYHQNIIEKLKTWRDKKIAHNDKVSVEDVDQLTLKDIDLLLEFSKRIVIIIGWAYLNTGYGVRDDYFLSSDSRRPSLALKRLLSKIY